MKRLLIYFFLLIAEIISAQVTERSLSQSKWSFRKKGDKSWMKAIVPGTVHTDLLANKKIEDPFYGSNEKGLQWIENEDWEYRTSVSVSSKELQQSHLELQFDGLDTYAKVYVNDSLVITADNMFRTWKADVKKYLKRGKNAVYIVFESAVKKGKEAASRLSYTLPGDEKVFTRKAQYQYGWDWGPRFVTCGIWKEVRLVGWNDARFLNVKCVQRSLNELSAQLEFICEVQSDVEANAYLDINKDSKDLSGEINTKIKLKKGINTCSLYYTVKDPQRWWCRGLGFPTTYGFRIDLSYDSRELDVKRMHIGLRTIELVEEPDSVGTSFYFKLNGVPVFMKGANFIPPDNFLPRLSSSHYDDLIRNVVSVNMNMVRVWGGGTYADDRFYEACDREGIMVWQDFMFACAMYPGDDHFVKNVAEESIEQVQRLRHHPCIAIWCGNNEVDEGWKNWGWQKQYNYSNRDSAIIAQDNAALFEGLLKDIVENYDGTRPYRSSSPAIGWGHKESLEQGDSHYWGVWWGMEPFEMYEKKVGRFMSEYGFQGMPPVSTLEKMGVFKKEKKRILYEDEYVTDLFSHRIDSLILKSHQKHPTGYQIITTYMKRDHKVPRLIENYSYVSQVLQAEGMKTAIEAHRRAKPYCMGSLYWQLNDCWPVTSWSSLDYYGNWKALHYQARRSFADLIISVEEKNDSCDIYVVSDLMSDEKGQLTMELYDLMGKLLFSGKVEGLIRANSSGVFCRFDKSISKEYNANDLVLKCVLETEHSSGNAPVYHYFSRPLNLNLQSPQFEINFGFCEKTQCFTISSNILAKNVYVSIPGYDVELSDNFFDLLPGENKNIFFRQGRVPNLTKKKIRILSLADAVQ